MKTIYKGTYAEEIVINRDDDGEYVVIFMKDDEGNWSEICIPCVDAVDIAYQIIGECV